MIVTIGKLLLFTMVGIPILLAIALFLDTWLKQRILRCYAAPWTPGQRNWYLLSCTLIVALLLQMVLIPVFVAPFFPDWTKTRTTELVLWGVASIIVALVWGIWLLVQWKRYGDRCPNGHTVQGPYAFDKRCPECGVLLNAWAMEPEAISETAE
jgi:hypothetical protein